jgi:hypothetical protein
MDPKPDDAVYPVVKIALVLDALAAEGVPKEDALRRVRLSEASIFFACDARLAQSGHRLLFLRRRALA